MILIYVREGLVSFRSLNNVLIMRITRRVVVYDEGNALVGDRIRGGDLTLRFTRLAYVTLRIARIGISSTNFKGYLFKSFRRLLLQDANVLRSLCRGVMRILKTINVQVVVIRTNYRNYGALGIFLVIREIRGRVVVRLLRRNRVNDDHVKDNGGVTSFRFVLVILRWENGAILGGVNACLVYLRQLRRYVRVVLGLRLLRHRILCLQTVQEAFRYVNDNRVNVEYLCRGHFHQVCQRVGGLIICPRAMGFQERQACLLRIRETVPFRFCEVREGGAFRYQNFRVGRLTINAERFALCFRFQFKVAYARYCYDGYRGGSFLRVMSSILFYGHTYGCASFRIRSGRFPSFFRVRGYGGRLGAGFLSRSRRFA